MAISVRRVTTDDDWEGAQAVRLAVFVAEQKVPLEIEIDEHDATARHWVARDGAGPVIGTARVVEKPDGTWKIGRVAVDAAYRGRGVGSALMGTILAEARAEGAPGAVLESQTHAAPFYAKLGFVAEGPEFLDAGIPHVLMRLALA